MAQEIERKFLVVGDAWRALAEGVVYRQGYLSTDAERSLRVRTAGPCQRAALPLEWSVLDPGADLAPGSRHIGTVEGVCAESSDEAWDPRELRSANRGVRTARTVKKWEMGSVNDADEHHLRAQRQGP